MIIASPGEAMVAMARLEILRVARDNDYDSSVLIMALADVVALTAVTLERQGDPTPLRQRMQSFEARVVEMRERYQRDMDRAAHRTA